MPDSERLEIILAVKFPFNPQLFMRSKRPPGPVSELKLAPELPTVTVPLNAEDPKNEIVVSPVKLKVAIPVVQLFVAVEKFGLLSTQ